MESCDKQRAVSALRRLPGDTGQEERRDMVAATQSTGCPAFPLQLTTPTEDKPEKGVKYDAREYLSQDI